MADLGDLGEAAKALHGLVGHPGWQHLQRVHAVRKAAFEKQVLSAAWAGEQPDLTDRAFLEALDFVLKQPELAEARFERAARKRGLNDSEHS